MCRVLDLPAASLGGIPAHETALSVDQVISPHQEHNSATEGLIQLYTT